MDVFVNIIFPHTARLCYSLPAEYFNLTYGATGFKEFQNSL